MASLRRNKPGRKDRSGVRQEVVPSARFSARPRPRVSLPDAKRRKTVAARACAFATCMAFCVVAQSSARKCVGRCVERACVCPLQRKQEAPFACTCITQLHGYEDIPNTSLCNKTCCIAEDQIVHVRVLDRKAAIMPHCMQYVVPSASSKMRAFSEDAPVQERGGSGGQPA
jgi:hypothetical protein